MKRGTFVRTTRTAGIAVILAALGHVLTLKFVADRAIGVDVGESLRLYEPPDSVLTFVARRDMHALPSHVADIVVAFIGSSTCAFSQPERVRLAVEQIANTAREEASSRQLSVALVGIAIDPAPRSGLEYLAEVWSFDEMVAGLSWRAEGAGTVLAAHVLESTPQIVVAERLKAAGQRQQGELALRYRLVGAGAIQQWADSGSRIPTAIMRESVRVAEDPG